MQSSGPGRLCRGTESGALKKPVSHPCTACPAGHYGAACLLKCSCQNNGTCEPTTGACRCGPGFYGPACEHCEWGCPLTLDTPSRLVLVLRAMATFSVTVHGERWDEPDQALGSGSHRIGGRWAPRPAPYASHVSLAWMLAYGGSWEGGRLRHSGKGLSQFLGSVLCSFWENWGFLSPPALDSL